MSKIVKYVVVVHGIGEARQNETILSVASRLAEARSKNKPPPPPPIVVPLGSATGQTGIDYQDGPVGGGLPWVEFAGIPCLPVPATAPFFGQASDTGENIRFVNIHWNDLLAKDWPYVGQTPEPWIDGLLGRLIRKDRQGPSRIPQWILETLRTLGESVSLADKITALRAKDLNDTIFNKYLGDVQLYGEFAYSRGRAVRRFHERMAAVAWTHAIKNPDDKAEYTVIGHSLGSVMAADALLLAHADISQYITANTPFPPILESVLTGYISGPVSTGVQCSWIKDVKSFVTLGSPIDKFLVIWWLNYEYLLNTSWYSEPRKIPHFNYCEEQDPVGHHLDVAYTAPAFSQIFQECEDRVYARFAVPGLAHVHYWDDLPLFEWILNQAIDDPTSAPPVPEPAWFIPGIYWWIVAIDYMIIPLIVAVANLVALNGAWNAQGFNGLLTGAVTFVVTWLLGRYVMDLMIWWRQILKAKAKIAEGGPVANVLAQTDQFATVPPGTKPADEVRSMVHDVGAAVWAMIRFLPAWVWRWCKPADRPQGQEGGIGHRQRWLAERRERAAVESQFQGSMVIIHGLSLLLLAFALAWYIHCFGSWNDLGRLAVLGVAIGIMLLMWLIVVHGEIAGFAIGGRRHGFRTICGRRIRFGPAAVDDQVDPSDRILAEGFFAADIPGTIGIFVATIIGIVSALIWRGRAPEGWFANYRPASTALLWAGVALSGAIGYARTRLARVKRSLKWDANRDPLNFSTYFDNTGGS